MAVSSAFSDSFRNLRTLSFPFMLQYCNRTTPWGGLSGGPLAGLGCSGPSSRCTQLFQLLHRNVVQKRKLQTDVVSSELGRKGRKGIGGADAGDGGAVQRLMSRASGDHELGNAAPAHDDELNRHSPANDS